MWVVTKLEAAPPFTCAPVVIKIFPETTQAARTSSNGLEWHRYSSQGPNQKKHGDIRGSIVDCYRRTRDRDACYFKSIH